MQSITYCLVLLLMAASAVRTENTVRSEITSYLDVLTCAVRTDPWQCVYSRSGKILDSLDAVIRRKQDELKVEADAEFQQRLASRAFGDTDISEKDKPSEIISSLENAVSDTVGSLIERAKGDKMKKMKKKKPSAVQLVEFQKPQIYELVEESDVQGHMHGGHGHMGGHHGGGHGHNGHKHGIGGHGGHGGHGLKMKKHGRSIGGKRGKHKKKKKKALMKLLLIGAVLKAKIELLLKIVTTHLQIKFFVVAVIGLLINIARFWVDLKRGHQPQKVVYYEHAHHQHVYDEHDDTGWGLGSSGSGSYWKRRSLNEKGEPIEVPAFSDGFNSGPPVAAAATYDPTYRQYESAPSSYGSIVPSAATYTDPHSIVYSKQKPDSYSGFL